MLKNTLLYQWPPTDGDGGRIRIKAVRRICRLAEEHGYQVSPEQAHLVILDMLLQGLIISSHVVPFSVTAGHVLESLLDGNKDETWAMTAEVLGHEPPEGSETGEKEDGR